MRTTSTRLNGGVALEITSVIVAECRPLCSGFIKTMNAASFTNVAAEEKKAKQAARKQAKEAEKANKESDWRTKLTRKLS